MIDIDFVITWVDGNDEKWQRKKMAYQIQDDSNEGNKTIRYRDFGLLKYWFRCVEKYTPWVHKIYLITDKQVPAWLNKSEKLCVIDHSDYIPLKYLPTFNSNVIEMFINQIPGLSEYYVYFNDDMYIVGDMNQEDFFKNGKPCDSLVFNAISAKKENNIIEHTILNNLELVAKDFNKRDVLKNGYRKIFSLKNGTSIVRTLLLLPWKDLTGIYNHHMPISYKKDIVNEAWTKYYDYLLATAGNRFRTKLDYSHWVFRYYTLLSLQFEPTSYKKTCFYSLKNDNTDFLNSIRNGKYKMVCINDDDETIIFDDVKKDIVAFFESFLPNKSCFERDNTL